jgi:hypothetical protein
MISIQQNNGVVKVSTSVFDMDGNFSGRSVKLLQRSLNIQSVTQGSESEHSRLFACARFWTAVFTIASVRFCWTGLWYSHWWFYIQSVSFYTIEIIEILTMATSHRIRLVNRIINRINNKIRQSNFKRHLHSYKLFYLYSIIFLGVLVHEHYKN